MFITRVGGKEQQVCRQAERHLQLVEWSNGLSWLCGAVPGLWVALTADAGSWAVTRRSSDR